MAISNNYGQDEIVADINMTPLIDIMLVLLIIFMVSSSAAVESGLDVSLPEASKVGGVQEGNVTITVSQSGEISVGGERISKDVLREKITHDLSTRKSKTVVLEGDGELTLTKTIEIIDIARAAGAEDFSIAAKLKEQ